MQKEILINVESQEKRVAVVEGGVLQDYYIERPSEVMLVGNIYKGIVNSIVSGIGAAFVDIGQGKNGFLYVADMMAPSREFDVLDNGDPALPPQPQKRIPRPRPSDISKLVKEKQEVLVQVIKEPIGNKGPRLTTHIGIPGRFLVLMPFDHHIGISKKVRDREERSRLHKILKKVSPIVKMGIIVRTAGVGKSERDIIREAKYLNALWHKIQRDGLKAKAPEIVHEEHGLTFRILRDIFSEDVSRVLVDNKDEYKKLRHFANNIMPLMKRKLMLYRERTSLFDSRGIEKDIEKLYRKKIQLKCGGYIFIEETEGLIAIDVNSGSFSRKGMEETAFKVNSEAAAEIARHMRMRDIGGIVIVDFIDMKYDRHARAIFDMLVESVKRDKARIKILKMSEFGIVQMTRQRIRKAVSRVSYQKCPYCSGRGEVKSVTTMAIEVLRVVRKELDMSRHKEVRAFVHPGVANYLLNEDRPSITKLESEYRTKIIIIAEPDMHIENFKINH
ncbi:MAG: Rne/Rng family ribonuclease [Candidatus Omnitrophica bacterium]|nr:Rne/Rng family ribonuclease [Candidatus Omnitrophota bacterium]